MAFALALRVDMKELNEEMRKQGVGWTTELEYWAYVDDITTATTAELAPLVVCYDQAQGNAGEHGLDRTQERQMHCILLTPERVECIREEVTQFSKWTPEGLMILETASDGEYRTEITTDARKSHEPTSSRLGNARMLAGGIRQTPGSCQETGDHCFELPFLLTVALSRLKPWLRTHRNLMKLLKLCSPCL